MKRLTKRNVTYTGVFVRNNMQPQTVERCLNKLQMYETREKEGLSLQFMCRVGDLVYQIEDEFLTVFKIISANYSNDGLVYKSKLIKGSSSDIYLEFSERKIGKDVFLSFPKSREELWRYESIKFMQKISFPDQILGVQHRLNMLREYETLEEDGWLKTLRCKVGDTVYHIVGYSIVEFEIFKISYHNGGSFYHWKIRKGVYGIPGFTDKQIGNDVFLSYIEAEYARAAGNNKA